MKTINKTIKFLAITGATLIIGLHAGMDGLTMFFLGCCLDLMNVSTGD